MYQLQSNTSPIGSMSYIKRLSDNAYIPFDPINSDYQEFLKWLEQGNKPKLSDP